jgi:PAS domain S-box-containing protein
MEQSGLGADAAAAACRAAACASGALTALIGATALVGWATDVTLLNRWVDEWVAMQPWAAVGFSVTGLAVCAHARQQAGIDVAAALAALLIGAVVMAEFVFDADLGVDRLLFRRAVLGQDLMYPGRMAEISAATFILLAASLLAGRTGWMRRWAWVVKTVGLAIAVTGAMGYLFGAVRLSAIGSYAPFALPTAVAFVCAFFGANMAEPEAGWVKLVTSPRLGGTMVRNLIPVTVMLPAAAGLAVHLSLGQTDIQPGFRMAVGMLVVMFGLSGIVGWLSKQVDDVDDQRLRAQAEAARVQARYQAMVETAADAMVVVGGHDEIVSVNPAAERIFGWMAPEIVGLPITTLVPAPGTMVAAGHVVKAVRRDGSTFPAELGVARWHDGRGVLQTWTMRDVSQTLTAERALRRNEARLRAVLDQAAVGIAQVSLVDGRMLEANPRLCAILGYEAGELATQDFRTLTAPPFREDEERLLGELVRGHRESYAIEKQYLRKDGSRLWVRVTSSIPRGEPFRISIVEDISEQRRMIDTLEKTNARLEMALAGARAGLWEWNTVTGDIEWEQNVYDLFGLDPARPPTFDNWASCLVPEDLAVFIEGTRRFVAERHKQFRLEFRVRHPGHGIRWLLGQGEAVGFAADGATILAAGITLDITPLKAAEEEARRARDEAERANRAKSTFLAAASHDLRQPVQAMVLLNAALEQRLKGHPAAQLVARLGTSVTALQMLLEGLLDVSRLDAGVVEVNPTDMPVAALLDRLRSEYELRCRPKGLRLRVVPCRAWIHSDPALLERIVRNLVENAIRYTERGSILIGCRRAGEALRIGVYDTGVGIPADQMALVFQEFYQLSNPERDRDKGLGLGLSIVNRLAELLGHRLTVRSVPGRGSAFTVAVPVVHAPAAEAPPVAAATPAPAGAVLVIDDEAMLRDSLATALTDDGWRVRTAASIEEAVAVAGAEPPDVILADYRLRAGTTGVGAAQQVEAACGRAIPTIVLTGDTDPERIAEVQRSGYRIAHKPVVAEKLRELLLACTARG